MAESTQKTGALQFHAARRGLRPQGMPWREREQDGQGTDHEAAERYLAATAGSEEDRKDEDGPPREEEINKERKTVMMKRWSVVALFALLSLLLSGCAFVNLALYPEAGPLKEKLIDGEGDRKILLLDITGIISEEKRRKLGLREETSMVDEFRESLKKAREDKKIAGLVIRINSPGGTVTVPNPATV